MGLKLKYEIKQIEAGDFSPEEIRAQKCGGADALVLLSILDTTDGPYSILVLSFDGRGRVGPLGYPSAALEPIDLWKAWMVLGTNIARLEGLDEVRRTIAAQPMAVFMATLAKKPAGSTDH